jgi:GH15 family glucan-1,4-alpha-glucosidase
MEFDDRWIDNYEKDIRSQEKKMRTVKVFYFYINGDNEIKKVNQNSIEIKDGVLNRDELMKLIVLNRQKHKLTQILKYIVTSVDENTDFKTFMTPNNLSDISFLDSPKIFESVNSLFFFFEEDEKKLKQKGTRKVVLHNTRNTRRKALKANQQKEL